MARISGVDIPNNKRVVISLTYIYGIGVASSNKILAKAGVNPDTRVKDLTDEEVTVYSRMIHASGDVDYGHLIRTSENAVEEGIKALAKGCNIYCDVNMVKAGINKNALKVLGSEVFLSLIHISEPTRPY